MKHLRDSADLSSLYLLSSDKSNVKGRKYHYTFGCYTKNSNNDVILIFRRAKIQTMAESLVEIERAASAIQNCKALIVTAGAGMGVDSGLKRGSLDKMQ